MAGKTKIEWADATFNPWVGCTKVSAACDSCYAEGWAKRAGHPELWHGERRRTSASNWHHPMKWNRQAEAAGIRKRVFCASLADVFDNQVPERWRDDLWHRIEQTPHLDWLLLTKRPQNIAKMLPDPRIGTKPWDGGWPNVWLGTTAEDQVEFDRRWPHLAAIPARVHFISYEPALGPLSIAGCHPVPDWIIAGGESGPKARPMHPEWVRSLRDQCQTAGTAFFLKQWGEWAPLDEDDERHRSVPYGEFHVGDGAWVDSCLCSDGAPNGQMARVGKKAAGDLLDVRQWHEFPDARIPA